MTTLQSAVRAHSLYKKHDNLQPAINRWRLFATKRVESESKSWHYLVDMHASKVLWKKHVPQVLE
eukprot:750391-Pelagomonas_calceolata.AAC.4